MSYINTLPHQTDQHPRRALVVVESRTKAKTIAKALKKILGDCIVLATYGHVRNLPPKNDAIDPDNHFATHYVIIEKNKKHITAIVQAMKTADILYLATDPDREGEAIAWHLCAILKARRALANQPVYRIVFHEITETAIKAALATPREIAINLVNAQRARQILDHLSGLRLSRLLWEKILYGLSAGRVQSPALRMIVEREEAISQFNPQEYWVLEATLTAQQQAIPAKLIIFQHKKLTQFSITTHQQAEQTQQILLQAGDKLMVSRLDQRTRHRHPAAPFITSTLQQEAARKLGFTAQRTMRIAQQLYEGIELDHGLTGLITYMRTDSVQLAAEAITAIRAFITARYSQTMVPDAPRIYRTKVKNAQEAHEAIRPTIITHTPDTIKTYLTPEQYKLYDLIWKRTLASQMISATIDTVSIEFSLTDQHMFRATGSVITDSGYMVVYQESSDEPADADDTPLPLLHEGEVVALESITCHQHFTEPPARYSEATLIKTLEEYGIGRPSTYAIIIATLLARNYVQLSKKRFHPTDIGRIVNHFLTRYFAYYVDYDFTAKMEDELDDIARGDKTWIELLTTFWPPFKTQLDTIARTVKRQEIIEEKLDEACPLCQQPLSIRLGKHERFIGCTGYPKCRYTRSLTNATETSTDETATTELPATLCPDCGSTLTIKESRYGKFIGCINYPACKHTEPLNKPRDTGITCPECKTGHLLKRQSRRGKVFFSCANYPTCRYAIWHEPVDQPCPNCAWPILTIKYTKKRGAELICPRQPQCHYTQSIDSE